jgi:hypothetical protein
MHEFALDPILISFFQIVFRYTYPSFNGSLVEKRVAKLSDLAAQRFLKVFKPLCLLPSDIQCRIQFSLYNLSTLLKIAYLNIYIVELKIIY